MGFVKMYLRVSRRSADATSSAPVPGVCPRFVAVVCLAPVPGVSFAITSSDFQDPVDSHLFHHREDYFVMRPSTDSTATRCSSPISPPIVVSGASGTLTCADPVHTFLLSGLRHSTRSTASISSYAISPPVVDHQSSGASRSVDPAPITESSNR